MSAYNPYIVLGSGPDWLGDTTTGGQRLHDPVLSRKSSPPPPPTNPDKIASRTPPRHPDWRAPGVIKDNSVPFVASSVRTSFNGTGYLIVIAETDQGILLNSYGITEDDSAYLAHSKFIGSGSLARVIALDSNRIVTAHKTNSNLLEINTYYLNATSGFFSTPLDTIQSSSIGNELEISANTGVNIVFRMMVSSVNSVNEHTARSFYVNGPTGDISETGSISTTNKASKISMARIEGFSERHIYGIAYRNSKDKLRVEAYEILLDGTLKYLGGRTESGEGDLENDASIRIAAYRQGGAFIAVQDSTPWQRMEAWSFDPPTWSENSSIDTTTLRPNKVASEIIAQKGIHAICRIPDNQAEGDFLLSQGDPEKEGITLQAWRSAPR